MSKLASKERVLEREQHLPITVAEAFEFFAAAGNLESITPAFLKFRIVTTGEIEMGEGTLIDYRLRIHGVPVSWRTEITGWEPDKQFVDEQIRGPYALWQHLHTFEPVADTDGGGTLMRDRVTYRVPFGPLGDIAHALFVRRDLKRIFDYRHVVLDERFGRWAG